MSVRKRLAIWAVVTGIGLAACGSRVAVPEGSQLSCTSASDCPTGWLCHQERCVSAGALDATPPDLASEPVVSPAVGRAGVTFTIDLTPSEPLGAAPEVTLGLVPPAAAPCLARGTGWRCSYTATGTENGGFGGVVSFDVRMVDRARNERLKKRVGALSMDFIAPALAAGSVAYYPDPSNPLPAVRRATAGTEVQVALSADELLDPASPPSLVVSLAGTPLAFELVAGSVTATGAVFRAVIPAGTPDGTYLPTVTWSDLAGNAAATSQGLPAIDVKTSAPALTVNQGAVTFVRSPWGNAVPEPVGAHVIPAGAYFALEPAEPLSPSARIAAGTFMLDGGVVPERVRVQLGSDPGALVLGTLLPDAGGTWPRQSLASPDVPTVHVVGVDDAGNESAPVKIANVEWIATSNPPWIGASPHALWRTPYVGATRTQRTDVTGVEELDLAGADGRAALSTAQEAWRKVNGTVLLPRVRRAAIAYDTARGRVVLFGGSVQAPVSAISQETWEWDGVSWWNATPPGSKPAGREWDALAYDSSRGCVVLFGGRASGGGGSYPEDTWEWDGTAWRDVTPAGARPPGRLEHALAYDSARRRVVLFGGYSAAGDPLGDSWEWDGRAWTEVVTSAGSPAARASHAMAFDGARGRVVLFGGNTAAGPDPATWEWDGSTWTSITPAGARPGSAAAMAFDAAAARVVLFDTVDLWTWDGATWTSVTPAGARPSAQGAMAFDAARARTVLFGRGSNYSADLWEWDGGSWKDVTPTGATPPGRYGGAMAYDGARGRTVLFGGAGGGQDTWEWDGSTWRNVVPAGAGPPDRSYPGLAYDRDRARVVLSGSGEPRDTWEWDGTVWTSITPGGTIPPSTVPYGAMAYDTVRRRVALVAVRDTWLWDGVTWTTITPATANLPRGLVSFDSARGRLVLLSTSTPWEWDGSSWTTVAPAGATPPTRGSSAVSFDSVRGRAVLFGGYQVGPVDDSWEWDGRAWREVTPIGTRPTPRRFHAMAFDSTRGRTVVFSGLGPGDQTLTDTWELDASPTSRPAIQLDVAASLMGIDASSVTGLRVRAHAGGTFFPGGPASVGATLLGWTSHSPRGVPGDWIELAANSSGVSAQQPYLGPPATTLIDWRSASAAEARPFIMERDGQLSFQVRPSGAMGPDPGGAQVALDFIEVRVRYRIP